jgi:hypothetical protein
MQADEYEEVIPSPVACQRGMSFTGYGKRATVGGEGVFQIRCAAALLQRGCIVESEKPQRPPTNIKKHL